jgi:LAS superfamily LD-carboxypeptidase LdcB
MQRRKKKILFFTVSLAVIIPFLANADNKNNPGNVNAQENKNFVNVEEEVLDESVVQKSQNENQIQNQVKTENAGEEKQLRVNTEEVLQAGEEMAESQVSKNHYAEFYRGNENFVAEKVKELLDIDNMQGGIG